MGRQARQVARQGNAGGCDMAGTVAVRENCKYDKDVTM